MKNKTNIFQNKKIIIVILVLCSLYIALLVFSQGNEKEQYGDYIVKEFFLENDRGAYNYGEIVIPDSDEDKNFPLVFIAHGFTGTLDSGGARELSQRLAKEGIAAVRIDFDSRIEPKKSSAKTNEYTLSTMVADANLAINYAIDNYNVDADRLGIYGRSMGGRVAMIMANESKDFDFKGLALIAPAGNEDAMVYYMGGENKWERMKIEAAKNGYVEKQGQKLTPEWFNEFEEYNPAETGYKYGDTTVLVFYNTLDNVVRPETSMDCAAGYKNTEIISVTTEDGHGYEMSYEQSEIKEMIMNTIAGYFKKKI